MIAAGGWPKFNICEHSSTVRELYAQRSRDLAEEMTCHAQTAALLAPHVTAGDTLLDAGCGSGYFYHSLRKRNIPVEYFGIDATSCFIDLGQQHLPAFGLPAGNLRTLRIEDLDAAVDHVACINVLSNIDNYHRPLERLLLSARKTGIVRESCSDTASYSYVRDRFLDPGDDGAKTPTVDDKSYPENSRSKLDGKSQVPTRTTGELPPADSHAEGGLVNKQKEETTLAGPVAERSNDRRSPAPGGTAALPPGQTRPAPESGFKRAGAQAAPFQGIKLVIPLTTDSRELSSTTLRMLDKIAGVAARNPKTFILLKVYPARGANSGQIVGPTNPQTASVTKYLVAKKISVSRIRTPVPDRGSLLERGRSLETSDRGGRMEIELTDVAGLPVKR